MAAALPLSQRQGLLLVFLIILAFLNISQLGGKVAKCSREHNTSTDSRAVPNTNPHTSDSPPFSSVLRSGDSLDNKHNDSQGQEQILQLQKQQLEWNAQVDQLTKLLQRSQEKTSNLRAQLRKLDTSQVLQISIPTGIVEDDGLQYKSCRRVDGAWQCRDCGSRNTTRTGKDDNSQEAGTTISSSGAAFNPLDWNECTLLKPHSPCSSWEVAEWDMPRPRRQTLQDHYASEDGLRYATERQGYRGAIEQIPCLQLQDCFDMSKCEQLNDNHDGGSNFRGGRGVLQVFMYGEPGEFISDMLAKGRLNGVINLTTSPEDACLFVVTPRSFIRKREEDFVNLTTSKFWNQGRNHFLFRSHSILDSDCDRFSAKAHNYQRASLSNPNFYRGTLRAGYDMPLYYDHPQNPFSVNDTIYELVTSSLHRPRSLMLSFQGTIKQKSPWFQHRWLVSAYWINENDHHAMDNDILVHIRCPSDNVTTMQGSNTGMDYLTTLLSSTFVFCPGGVSPGSWRFGEALAMGAIPIVTTDFLAPFDPDLSNRWNQCLVRINEGRIIDLPRIVRQRFTLDDIRQRQVACHELFVATIGWMRYKKNNQWAIDFEGTSFVTAMHLWKSRILEVVHRRNHAVQLVEQLHAAAESVW